MKRAVLEFVGVLGSTTVNIDVEMPETPDEYAKGLAGRKLPSAMYFAYPHGSLVTFATRGMLFPIWFATIDSRRVIDTLIRLQPNSGNVTPPERVFGVIELPATSPPAITVGSVLRSVAILR